ncbi:DUF6063 family protein [Anaerosporobacter faecicola]|uniref:DUF6063 family protein n=1 Tax=Anaerosporobacter faecicola TaxID=2718714 RepID=UPI001EE5D9D6|nr:DUF6063 family protein [Anaerosporobacter faecicola]
MDNHSFEKAMELFGKLIAGEEISVRSGKNAELYKEYRDHAEVSNLLDTMLTQMNLKLYEYNESLFITAGNHNHVFGYTNEELRRLLGVRLNKELYLCYFIIYQIITKFYTQSGSYTYTEYVKIEDIMKAVDAGLHNVISNMEQFRLSELEENSFEAIANLWDELPSVANEENMGGKASRGSRYGYLKMVFNFLLSQSLFLEMEERYYITDRFRAVITRYFEEERGRLYEIMTKEEIDNASY